MTHPKPCHLCPQPAEYRIRFRENNTSQVYCGECVRRFDDGGWYAGALPAGGFETLPIGTGSVTRLMPHDLAPEPATGVRKKRWAEMTDDERDDVARDHAPKKSAAVRIRWCAPDPEPKPRPGYAGKMNGTKGGGR